MSTRTYAELQKYNPARKPEWRYARVQQMAERFPTPGRCTVRDDEYVRRARSFVLRWRGGSEDEREGLWRENPGLYYAWLLREGSTEDPQSTFTLEARILAGQDFGEIAHEMGTLPETVDWYEKLWFHVTDRLDRQDWVLRNVLLPAASRALTRPLTKAQKRDKYYTPPIVQTDLDYSLKFFGYYGGPLLLEFMMSGFVRGNRARTREECEDYLVGFQRSMLGVKAAQAARNFEVNKFNVTFLFEAHARLLDIQKRAEQDQAGGNVVEKNIGALLNEFPWAVGRAGRATVAGTPLEFADEAAAELRDHELLLAAAGEPLEVTAEVVTMALPPPRPKEEAHDGHVELR